MVFLGGITAIPSGISGLNRFAEVAFRYGNVGRLKPDPVGDYIRIIVDSPGEIGTINQGDAEKVLRYKEIRQVDPVGTFKLSASRNEFKGEIPEMGGVMDVVRQVSRFPEKNSSSGYISKHSSKGQKLTSLKYSVRVDTSGSGSLFS